MAKPAEKSREIKVLHIIGSGTFGGAENFAYSIASYQHEHDPVIGAAMFFRHPQGPFYERAKAAGLPVFSSPPIIRPRGFWAIARRFKEFEILHFHGLYPALFLARVFARRPAIYSIHGTRAQTKSLARMWEQFSKKKKLPRPSGLKRFMKKQWYRFFLSRLTHVNITPTAYYKELYREKYKIAPGRMTVIPYGIDFSTLKVEEAPGILRKRFGIAGGMPVIGTVSTFRKIKRIDRLVDAFAALPAGAKGGEPRLVLVSDGAERDNLEKQAADLGISGRVVFTGFQEKASDFLGTMDIFVLPSESESFSIACAEAMYFKLPVIVFAGSGGAEELVRRAGGIVVRDVPELTRRLEYLMQNKGEREKLGEKLHHFVTRELSLEKMAETFRGIYMEATAS